MFLEEKRRKRNIFFWKKRILFASGESSRNRVRLRPCRRRRRVISERFAECKFFSPTNQRTPADPHTKGEYKPQSEILIIHKYLRVQDENVNCVEVRQKSPGPMLRLNPDEKKDAITKLQYARVCVCVCFDSRDQSPRDVSAHPNSRERR